MLDALTEAAPVTAGEARSYLARFLFRGEDAFKEVRLLSGGERSRLEMALLGIQPANLLLLDEPTNHLDIPAREAIEAFMRDSPATLLVVSHDRRLLETVCERLWVVGDRRGGRVRWWLQGVAGRRWPAAGRWRQRPGSRRTGDGRARPSAAKTAPVAEPRARSVPQRRLRPLCRDARHAPTPAPGKAVEGRLQATEGGAGRRTDPARPAQEPPGTLDERPAGRREFRRDAPGDERARGRRPGPRGRRGHLARARGARTVSQICARSERTLRIGLTGPIGCGKSTVAGWLGERPGVVTIDADVLARAVLAPDTAEVTAVYARFGEGLRGTDGALDRAALGRIVFADAAALAALESIVHPAVRMRIIEAIRTAERTGARIIVIEAIKLVEGGLSALCDEIWLVTCDPAIQLRSGRRSGRDVRRRRSPHRRAGRPRGAPAAARVPDHRHERVDRGHEAFGGPGGGRARRTPALSAKRPSGRPCERPTAWEARRVSGAEVMRARYPARSMDGREAHAGLGGCAGLGAGRRALGLRSVELDGVADALGRAPVEGG
ncbi:MAG: dephospho-CoA kinase [Candidatus Limnocylindrales bacterium]